MEQLYIKILVHFLDKVLKYFLFVLNALITLKEFLEDYASAETKRIGEAMIARELSNIPNEKTRGITADYIGKIAGGERDFRF